MSQKIFDGLQQKWCKSESALETSHSKINQNNPLPLCKYSSLINLDQTCQNNIKYSVNLSIQPQRQRRFEVLNKKQSELIELLKRQNTRLKDKLDLIISQKREISKYIQNICYQTNLSYQNDIASLVNIQKYIHNKLNIVLPLQETIIKQGKQFQTQLISLRSENQMLKSSNQSKIVQKQKLIEVIIQKIVEKPIFIEKFIQVEKQAQIIQKIVNVPIFIENKINVEVPVFIEKPVEKIVIRQKPIYIDRQIQKIVYKQKIIQKPIFVDRIIQKIVHFKQRQHPQSEELIGSKV